jgi:hypothetical protein
MAGDRTNMNEIDFDKQEKQIMDRAAKFRESSKDKMGVIGEVVDIYSDGTRMSATLWKTVAMEEEISKKGGSNKMFPGILLAHGFGGKRGHLDYSYAPAFCAAGFMVLTFSYRGWDDSDGVLVPEKTSSSG